MANTEKISLGQKVTLCTQKIDELYKEFNAVADSIEKMDKLFFEMVKKYSDIVMELRSIYGEDNEEVIEQMEMELNQEEENIRKKASRMNGEEIHYLAQLFITLVGNGEKFTKEVAKSWADQLNASRDKDNQLSYKTIGNYVYPNGGCRYKLDKEIEKIMKEY